MVSDSKQPSLRWYEGITGYQWLVLTIASLGWIFDIFEGQYFVASMRDAMPALLGVLPDDPLVSNWNDRAFGSFLLGGAFGGVLFGMLGDKIGRSKTMIITILFYSLFTCVTAFAQEPWHMVLLRFFVAMGVGGEWAVASAMVAEVMPNRSRPVMSSIFHASSVFGTLLAVAAGAWIIGNPALDTLIPGVPGWRVGFALGVLPAILTLFVRWKLREPEQWTKSKQLEAEGKAPARGRISELFDQVNLRNTLVGVSLSSIGLVTFWGGHIYGKNALLRLKQGEVKILKVEQLQRQGYTVEQAEVIVTKLPARASAELKLPEAEVKKVREDVDAPYKPVLKQAEMTSMTLNTIGGGLGLVLFGTISTYLGRKGAFVLYHVVAFVMMLLMFQVLLPMQVSATVLTIVLPVFGFFTLGMHAGYAVYFPELYPTRLRGTGAGFCFNMGRLATAAAFFGFFYVSITPEAKALWLSPLYLVGVVVILFARETRGTDLRE
ncbi:MAG: MFS transporter [Blastopirellula sp.]|nr:MFS transporter [Blastopirellula sp.]